MLRINKRNPVVVITNCLLIARQFALLHTQRQGWSVPQHWETPQLRGYTKTPAALETPQLRDCKHQHQHHRVAILLLHR